ncbi:hypothetical protein [Sphingomonas sp. M1A8_2b]
MARRFMPLLSVLLASCGGGDGSTGASGEAVTTVPAATPSPTPTPAATPAATPTAADASALPTESGATAIIFAASDLPVRASPYIVGAATHFSYATLAGYDPDSVAQRFTDSGIRAFREDLYWNALAPDWDVNGAHLPQPLMTFLGKTSARPLYILNNSNAWIPGASPPVADAGQTAFAAYAQHAVAATTGRDAIYEIWNEWNRTVVRDKPVLVGPGDASDYRASRYYAPLAARATSAIKQVAPSAKVLVGAAGDDPDWQWTLDVLARGAAAQADGVSAHIYNHCANTANRTASEALGRLTTLHTKIAGANGGRDLPLYVTEWGWPAGTNTCSVSATRIATNVPQFLLHTAALPWVAGSWYYETKDSGIDPTNIQYNFGLYDANYAAKSAQCAFADASAVIADAKAMAVQSVDTGLTVIRVTTPRGLAIVAWSAVAGRQGRITVGGTAAFTTRTLCGATGPGSSDRSVAIGEMPVVIDVPNVSRLGVNARLL